MLREISAVTGNEMGLVSRVARWSRATYTGRPRTQTKSKPLSFVIGSGWTLIWSTNLLIVNKLKIILRRVFDGSYGIHEARNYRQIAAQANEPPSPSNKDIGTDAETIFEGLYMRRGQAPFPLQDPISD